MNSEEYKKDYKEQLSTLLDTTYELEGLIKLALNEQLPDDVFSKLLMHKVETMLGQAQNALDVACLEAADMQMPEAELHYAVEEEATQSDPEQPYAVEEEDCYRVEAEDDVETCSDNDVFSEVEAETEDADGDEIEADMVEAEIQEQEPPVYSDPEKTPVEVKSEKKQVAADQATPRRQAPNLNTPLRMFSINDRFRFRRELFGGSDQAMRMALETVAEFEAYSESEEYFYSELGWNPERPEVGEFMSIVAGYFSRR